MKTHVEQFPILLAGALVWCLWHGAALGEDATTPTFAQFQAYEASAQQMIGALQGSAPPDVETLYPDYQKKDGDLATALAIARLRLEAARQGATPSVVAGIDLFDIADTVFTADMDRGIARHHIDMWLLEQADPQRVRAMDQLTTAVESNRKAAQILGPIQQALAPLNLPPLLLIDVQTSPTVAAGDPITMLIAVANVGDQQAVNLRLELDQEAIGKKTIKVNLGDLDAMSTLEHAMSLIAPQGLSVVPLMLNVYADNAGGNSAFVGVDVTAGGP